MLVQHHGSATSAVFHDQVHSKMEVHPMDPFLPIGLCHQYAHHFIPRRITTGTEDPATAMCCFPCERKLAPCFIEFCSPSDQFLNTIRPFLDKHPHRLPPA